MSISKSNNCDGSHQPPPPNGIPLRWLQKAAQLPGKTLALGLALWHESRRAKTRTVTLSDEDASRWGAGRKARYNALDALEAAGLIALDRRPGTLVRATLLDVPADENANHADSERGGGQAGGEAPRRRRGRPRRVIEMDDESVDAALGT